MIFFFKPKTIHLDCFTTHSGVYEYSPIVPASQCYPDWWKKLPKSEYNFDNMSHSTNMKSCAGFLDYHSESICIRLWCDLALKLVCNMNGSGENGYHYHFSDQISDMTPHLSHQYGEFLNSDYQHFKLISPWLFKCKEDVNWVFVGNSWNNNLTNDMNIVPGVVNYKYQHGTNIQAIFKYEKNKESNKFFNHNTPLVNIFPMSERKVVIHNHLIDKSEFHKIESLMSITTFGKVYLNNKRIKKSNESKCPFHF